VNELLELLQVAKNERFNKNGVFIGKQKTAK